MERPRITTILALGLALSAGPGCNSPWHRRGIPPEPPKTADTGGARFNSEPPAVQTPPGPLSSSASMGSPTGPSSRGGMSLPGLDSSGSAPSNDGGAPAGRMSGGGLGSQLDTPNM